MKAKLALVAAVATLVAAVGTGLTTAAPAGAQPQPGLTVPCTDGGTPITNCALELVGFNNSGGVLSAVFRLTNTLTGQVTRFAVPIGVTQGSGSCTILDLETGPIDLFLLGLDLHIDPIHIILTAQRGTLLGDLLCGLFFGNPVGGLLNQALRNGLITTA
jgi:hypothetical protein